MKKMEDGSWKMAKGSATVPVAVFMGSATRPGRCVRRLAEHMVSEGISTMKKIEDGRWKMAKGSATAPVAVFMGSATRPGRCVRRLAEHMVTDDTVTIE